MRAFVGIGLPSSSARAVSAATGPLRSQRHQLRLVSPGNLHLTVAFLGDIERSQQGPIGVALKDSVVGSAALELRLRPPIANPVFSGRVIALAVFREHQATLRAPRASACPAGGRRSAAG